MSPSWSTSASSMIIWISLSVNASPMNFMISPSSRLGRVSILEMQTTCRWADPITIHHSKKYFQKHSQNVNNLSMKPFPSPSKTRKASRISSSAFSSFTCVETRILWNTCHEDLDMIKDGSGSVLSFSWYLDRKIQIYIQDLTLMPIIVRNSGKSMLPVPSLSTWKFCPPESFVRLKVSLSFFDLMFPRWALSFTTWWTSPHWPCPAVLLLWDSGRFLVKPEPSLLLYWQKKYVARGNDIVIGFM